MQRRIPAAGADAMYDDATAQLEKHGLLVSEVDSKYVEFPDFWFFGAWTLS